MSMRPRQVAIRALILVGLSVLIFGQSGGRFEETKRQALAYLESDQFDRAAGKLEEIWDQDQSDATVAEGLGIAYLNGEDRRYHPEIVTKVRALMEKAVANGGKATFLVQHSHEKLGFLQGKTINNYCSGSLSISRDRLIFVAHARKGIEPHSFDLGAGEFKISGPDADDKRGVFEIKAKSKNYAMAPRTRIKSDGDLVLTIVQENFTAKQEQKGR